MSKVALILAGHGSHIRHQTAGIVWQYVDQLRRLGVAHEVTACFWKEQPAYYEVLDTVTAPAVVIVPVFLADGYFMKSVIPAELGLDKASHTTWRCKQTVHITRPLGTHPGMADIIQKRTQDALKVTGFPKAQTAVAIIGHGTKRNQQSRTTTQRQVALLQQADIVAEVLDAYLDDEPPIASIYQRTPARHIIVIPYLLAEGSHTAIDIPQALEVAAQQATSRKDTYYTDPIGIDENIYQYIIDLVHAAGMKLSPTPSNGEWDNFPRYGHQAFIDAVREQESMQFGQLLVNMAEVRPIGTEQTDVINVETPETLQRIVREQPFRPLATSDDLPPGWRCTVPTPETLPAIVETIYPGAIAAWARANEGQLSPEPFSATIARQKGMFGQAKRLTKEDIQTNVEFICGGCVRTPLWHINSSEGGNIIPCKAPCNMWLSKSIERERTKAQ